MLNPCKLCGEKAYPYKKEGSDSAENRAYEQARGSRAAHPSFFCGQAAVRHDSGRLFAGLADAGAAGDCH